MSSCSYTIVEESPLSLQMQNTLDSPLCRDHQFTIEALKLSTIREKTRQTST